MDILVPIADTELAEILGILTAIVTAASAITAVTKTPPEGSWKSKVYKLVEFLAIVVGKAKDK